MQPTVQKRNPKRSSIFLGGHVEGPTGRQDVRIRNVSADGALIETSNPLSIEEGIVLSCGDAAINGRVAWGDGTLFGVEFAEPLTGTSLADATGSKMQVSAPRSYRHDRFPDEDEQIELAPRIVDFHTRSL